MHRGARTSLVAIVMLGAGCTFLIDFEEVDEAVDASANEAAVPEAASDAPVPDDAVVPFPPPCDPTFPLSEVACNPSFPRPNCAENTGIFPSYPAGKRREGDLVTCNGGTTPTCVQHCPFGCAKMPAGFPDACDDCNGRPDGTYCVKDLRNADGRTLDVAIECKGGRAAEASVCGAGRCASKCPRSDPSPSCCI